MSYHKVHLGPNATRTGLIFKSWGQQPEMARVRRAQGRKNHPLQSLSDLAVKHKHPTGKHQCSTRLCYHDRALLSSHGFVIFPVLKTKRNWHSRCFTTEDVCALQWPMVFHHRRGTVGSLSVHPHVPLREFFTSKYLS